MADTAATGTKWNHLVPATRRQRHAQLALADASFGHGARTRASFGGDSGRLVPVDLTIANSGDADEQLNCAVVVHWNGLRPVACDALPAGAFPQAW